MKTKEILYTIGCGKKYLRLAINLENTLRQNGCSDPFYIITDLSPCEKLPSLISENTSLIFLTPDLYKKLHLNTNTLRWNLSTKSGLNPLLAKISPDLILPVSYDRITFLDADSVLNCSYSTFFPIEEKKSQNNYFGRINKNKTLWNCLTYFKKGEKIIDLEHLVPSSKMEEATTMPGSCSGFFSLHKNFSSFGEWRSIYEENQPCSDQEALNLLLSTSTSFQYKIKNNIAFNEPDAKTLIHFTHGKSRAFSFNRDPTRIYEYFFND